jgi:iron-sulfur cluster assembly protein
MLTAVSVVLGCGESPDSGPLRLPAPSASPNKEPRAQAQEAPPIIAVTQNAAATVRQIITDHGVPATCYLRLRVVPGGCQGYMHKLDLDPDVSAEDHVCESAGIKVVIFKRQIEMLRGSEVDYGVFNGERGFKVENPNFKSGSVKKWLALLEKEKDIR